MRAAATSLTALALAGCGGARLPAAEAPSPPPVTVGGATVRLDTGARTLTARGRTVPAGLGPSSLAPGDGRVYVTDRAQDALLVFDLEPELHLQRRVYVADGPRRVVRRGDVLVITTAHGSEERTADGAARRLRTK